MERLTIMTKKGPALNVTATTEAEARKQVYDMFLQVLAAAFYEIEQRQEQGCEWCIGFSPQVTGDLYSDYKFCPMCGRKLVE